MANDSYDVPAAGMQPEDHNDDLETFEELKRRASFERRADIPSPTWAPDDQHPDYAHLLIAEKKNFVSPRSFSLTPDVLDLLIAANSFQPKGPKDTFVFAIRGGEMATGSTNADSTKVELNDVRPDHKDFHCTIGFYHRGSRKITAFRASTVPNVHYMTNYFKMANKIGSWSDIKSNLLPSGLYRYRVGTHRGKVTPALQLADYNRPSEHGDVTVLRTTDVMSYRCDGFWERCLPGDNVHCAYSNNDFSSAGCQTIQGGDKWGPFGDFQKVLNGMGQGAVIDYVLFTGKEAAIAAMLIAKGQQHQTDLVDACLRRLRGGSEGPEVVALQTLLGIAKPSGFFDADTRKKMVQAEAKLGRADVKTDSIFSPEDEKAFGWSVFSATPKPATIVDPPKQAKPVVSSIDPGPSLGSAGFRPETLILVAGPANSQLSPDFKTLVVPGEGTWTVGPKIGMLNFTPEPNFSGRTQQVRYEIHDIYNRSAIAAASVTVASANRPPLLTEDAARTFAGQHVSVSVLMNDVAVEGVIDPATLQLADTPGGTLTANRQSLTVPNQGIWSVAPKGVIDFAPVTGFIGVARATYQVGTTAGGIATSTVTVTVDPAVGPMALSDDTVDTAHGQAVAIDVLKNDSIGQAAVGPGIGPAVILPAGEVKPSVVDPIIKPKPGEPVGAGFGTVLPAGTVKMTADALKRLAPKAKEKYVNAFAARGDQILAQFGINANARRLSHFMAQMAHECTGFTAERESLNYTAARLCQVWPKRFPSLDAAAPYAHNEEKLGNYIYGGRNGNTAPDDGFKFRGRGMIQLTGRGNYHVHSTKLGLDLEGNPDLAMEGEQAIRIAASFWQNCTRPGQRSMNELADADNIEQITQLINGGQNGISDRRALYAKAWDIWGTGRAPRSAPDIGELERGDAGERGRKLKELLFRAGYDPGPLNDQFDGQCERAVMLFQNDQRRNVDGHVDLTLWKALEAAPARTAGAPTRAPEQGGRRRQSDRDPKTLDPRQAPSRPDWLARHREIIRLVAAILLIAALATLTLGSIDATNLGAAHVAPTASFLLPAVLGGLALLLFVITAFGPPATAQRSEAGPFRPPTPIEMGGSAAPAQASSESQQPAPSLRDQAADDEALRKLGIDPAHFDETEPIRAFPAQGEDADPSAFESNEPQMLVPVGIAPQAAAKNSVRGAPAGGLEPFNVAAGDARFAIIGMFGGDNNLSNQVAFNFNQMVTANRAGGVTAVLGLIDLLDAPASIVEITPSGEQRVIAQMGEIDTGDPETLAKFLSRALISYPNAKKAIGFWDHGSGVFKEQDAKEQILTRSTRGAGAGRAPARRLLIPAAERAAMMAARDKRAMLHDNSGGVLTNLEAGHMLEAAFSRAGQSGPVDLIYSDTCLNGMIEVLEELGHYGATIAASAETEPSNGWNYEGWLRRMARQTPQTPEDWGRHAVDAFADGYRERTDQFPCTLAAFRSDNLITERFADLVQVAARSDLAAWSLLSIARGRSQNYDTRDSFDIISFARQLTAIGAQAMPELGRCAQALDQAAREARISHVWMGNDVRGAEGLAFWFPGSAGSYEADVGTYRRLRFAKATGWAEYLGRMYTGAV